MNKIVCFRLVLLMLLFGGSASIIFGQTKGSSTNNYLIKSKHTDEFSAISPYDISIGGEIGRRIDVTMNNNIKNLNLSNDFTDHFIKKTGPEVVGGFIGMGMLIDASVRLAAYSSDPEILRIKNKIIEDIIYSQLENGYSGFYKKGRRLWNNVGGGDNWDIHELGFIIDGLISDFQLFGKQSSLDAAIKTADFVLERWDNMPNDYAVDVDMHVLDTGFDWAIIRLYRITGENRYLNFAENIKSLYDWNTPITIGRRPGVSGHMFAYFAMCMAQIELYRITEKNVLLEQTEKAMEFFLQNDGLTITGSAGIREIWTNDQDGEGHLGETCATAYQLRVYESLLRLTGDSKYGDLIERTLYNGLFAAQSPKGDKLRYYTPFEGEREYYRVEYMCCPGNFRRIISEIPGMVGYLTKNNGIAINLFTDSYATFSLKGKTDVSIKQETNYPTSGDVRIIVSPTVTTSFPMFIRIPAYSKKPKITVNGNVLDRRLVGGKFFKINRVWSKGDTIDIEFDMNVRFVKGRKKNSGKVAVMRGPIIYGLNLDINGEVTANGKRKYNDLRRILIDPKTISEVYNDTTVRPNGTALSIKAWREELSGKANKKHEFEMKLTEFPDPNSKMIYFKIPDYSIEIDDELVSEELQPIRRYSPIKEK